MVYSGSWDSSVKFWDVRTNKITHQINSTQTCGDSIDMDNDNQTFVTGGGTGGEGIQLWDMRNLTESTTTIHWGTDSLGDPIKRSYLAVKFIPGMSTIVAGVKDDVPAKCFNYKTKAVIQEFDKLQKSCFTIDVSKDGSRMAMADYCGDLQIENLVYTSL